MSKTEQGILPGA
jgi:hypothetical protein